MHASFKIIIAQRRSVDGWKWASLEDANKYTTIRSSRLLSARYPRFSCTVSRGFFPLVLSLFSLASLARCAVSFIGLFAQAWLGLRADSVTRARGSWDPRHRGDDRADTPLRVLRLFCGFARYRSYCNIPLYLPAAGFPLIILFLAPALYGARPTSLHPFASHSPSLYLVSSFLISRSNLSLSLPLAHVQFSLKLSSSPACSWFYDTTRTL